MRYFTRLTNNGEYIILYTNIKLSDTKTADSDSYIFTLYDLFKDFAAVPLSRVYVIHAEPLVFSFCKEDADEKNYEWTDLVEEILLIFRMHIDNQDLKEEFVEEPRLEKEIQLPNSEDAIFMFELNEYKLEHEIVDDSEQYEVDAKHFFNEGKLRGATHLFIIDDIRKEYFTYLFIYPNEDPLHMYHFYNTDENMEVVMVYFLYKPFDKQFFQVTIYDEEDDEDFFDDDDDEDEEE